MLKLIAGIVCICLSALSSFGLSWLMRGPDQWYTFPALLLKGWRKQ